MTDQPTDMIPFSVAEVDEIARTVTVIHKDGHRLTFKFPPGHDDSKQVLAHAPGWVGGHTPDEPLIGVWAATAALAEAQQRGWA